MNRHRDEFLRRPSRPNGLRWMQHQIIALAACVLAGATDVRANETEPSPDDALSTPAAELAQAYLSTRFVLEKVLPYLKDGGVNITIHIGGEEITAKNAAAYRRRYESRNRVYVEAIRQRGQESLAGAYIGMATESCARAGSSWIGLIRMKEAAEIRIDQDGADAALIVSVIHEGESVSLKSDAAVVESAIAVSDQMNSDYYSLGELQDGKIVIRPDIRVLSAWPEWAGPPKRKDILECSVQLIPVSGADATG